MKAEEKESEMIKKCSQRSEDNNQYGKKQVDLIGKILNQEEVTVKV